MNVYAETTRFQGTAAKPWKGEGAGVLEVVESFDGNAYRAIYTDWGQVK